MGWRRRALKRQAVVFLLPTSFKMEKEKEMSVNKTYFCFIKLRLMKLLLLRVVLDSESSQTELRQANKTPDCNKLQSRGLMSLQCYFPVKMFGL